MQMAEFREAPPCTACGTDTCSVNREHHIDISLGSRAVAQGMCDVAAVAGSPLHNEIIQLRSLQIFTNCDCTRLEDRCRESIRISGW